MPGGCIGTWGNRCSRQTIHPVAEVLEIQRRAVGLLPPANTHRVDMEQTLAIACQENISTYDARFIVLARSCRTKLITEDSRLRSACPEDTLSLKHALAR